VFVKTNNLALRGSDWSAPTVLKKNVTVEKLDQGNYDGATGRREEKSTALELAGAWTAAGCAT
jgi:hypothetical protein